MKTGTPYRSIAGLQFSGKLTAIFFACCVLTYGTVRADARSEGLHEAHPKAAQELTTDILYNVLMGEVAAHRQHFEEAYKHYREAAFLSSDALVAERAVQLALLTKDLKGADASVKQWIERDPDSLDARQFAVGIALEGGKLDEADKQLRELVRLSKAQDENGYLLAARGLSKAEDKKWALAKMESLVQMDSSDADAWYAYAILAAEFEDDAKALMATDKVIALKPDWHKALMLKIKLLWEQERKDEALDMLGRMVAADADNKELRYTYARFLVDAAKHEQAYLQFNKLWREDIAAGRKGMEVRYALAVLAMQLKRYAEAKNHFTVLQQSAKHRSEAAYFLGRIAEDAKDYAKAMKWYREVQQGRYEFEAQLRIAENTAKAGKLTEARSLLHSLRKQRPNHAVRIYIIESSILREVKAPQEEVWALFEKGLKEHPGDAELLYSRALFAATIPRLDILERDLQTVLKKNPKHADALNALGYTLADMTDRLQEAEGYIKQALELKPDNPAILDSMGWLNYRMGNSDAALEYLRKAIKELHDPEIAAHLGEVLWKAGKGEEAKKVWHKALDEFSDNEVLLKTIKRFGIEFK